MHDVLRQRLLRKLESLPEDQIYQVLDYIEFLESKYAGEVPPESTSGLQRFAERLEDRMRKKAVSPTTLREAFQVIAAADRALSSVSSAGKQLLSELNGPGSGEDVGSRRREGSGESREPRGGRGGSDARDRRGGAEEDRPPPVGGGYRPRKRASSGTGTGGTGSSGETPAPGSGDQAAEGGPGGGTGTDPADPAGG